MGEKLENFVPSLLLITTLVLTHLIAETYIIKLEFGIYPRDIKGLKGILCSPLLHSDWKHLLNNAAPVFVLGVSLRYFYKKIAREVFLWSWFISGLWLWTFGREGCHIGASGILYSIASFLFFSGIFRRHTKLMAVSLFVVFLYGGLVWGLFPIEEKISWEGHVSGALAGILLSWWFRNEGPPKEVYQYELEEENNLERE